MNPQPRRALLNPKLKRPSALLSTPRNPEYLWLDKNENVDPVLMDVSKNVLQEIPSSVLATYPEAGELYRKLAQWVGVRPDSLLLTPGSDGAIRLVFESFVEHGDSVVHTAPTFAMYPVYSQMFGAEVHTIEYERNQDGPRLDVSAILGALKKHAPRLLCLPNPDSPTGTVLPPDILRGLLTECEKAGSVLLLDEAYHPFYEWSAVSWTESSPNLIVARTFAKAWGAAGLRIGYAVANPETIAFLHKMRPMYEVSSLAVEFMSRMFDHLSDVKRSVQRIQEGKTFFVDAMRASGFPVIPTNGNFVHVAFGSQGKSIHAALSKKVLYRVNFDHPCLEGYSRFTAAPKDMMALVTDIVKDAKEKKS